MPKQVAARTHRMIGILLAVPFVLWTATGLLFQLKPGWGRAYDLLSEQGAGPLQASELLPAATVAPGAVSRLELFPSALGPLYRVASEKGQALFDARTGRQVSPLDPDAARRIAEAAVAASRHAARYGQVTSVDAGAGEIVVAFSSGARVAVDRHSARLSQRGRDTDRIDWLYRVHYLQWTGIPAIDRPLSVVAIAATWFLVGFGVFLFIRRRRAT